MSLPGIDVSDHQGQVNWPAVAEAGIKFAFTKATEGATFVANTFAENWVAMQAAGIVRGAYHFFRPFRDPEAQARNLLQTAQLGLGDLPAVLDIEVRDGVDPGTIIDRMKDWLDIVEAGTGRKPLVYTSPGFWQTLGSPRFSDYPLWIAHHGRNWPTIPRGWTTFAFWQYSSSGELAGITGRVDLDVFNGSPDDLEAFIETGRVPVGGQVSDDLVHEGDKGSDVEQIQTFLRAKGFDPGPIDGVFGPRTKVAVIAFQRANNLIVDGIVGPQTLAKLHA